jgi:hypothetical protein
VALLRPSMFHMTDMDRMTAVPMMPRLVGMLSTTVMPRLVGVTMMTMLAAIPYMTVVAMSCWISLAVMTVFHPALMLTAARLPPCPGRRLAMSGAGPGHVTVLSATVFR